MSLVHTLGDKPLMFKIVFDRYGNLYFVGDDLKDNPYFRQPVGELRYQVNVDRNNEPYAERAERADEYIPLNENVKQTREFKKRSLAEKVENEKENKQSEELDYCTEDSDDDIQFEEDGPHNKQFVFAKHGVINVPIHDIGSEAAIYDTHLNDNGVIHFRSSSPGSTYYTIVLNYTVGHMIFRINGSKSTTYKIVVNPDGNLFFLLDRPELDTQKV